MAATVCRWYLEMNKWFNGQHGIILPMLVFILLALTMTGLSLGAFALNQQAQVNRDVFSRNALLVAEAGAERSIHELNEDSAFTGFGAVVEFDTGNDWRSSYTTTIENGSLQNERIITSTGYIYAPANSSDLVASRKVRILVVGTTSSGYSVQTGPGGLIMKNSATITDGEVYINGYLEMNNSAKIGTSTNPVNTWVAHYNCPDGGGSSYPTLCSSGEPITINHNAHIYGAVRATNQTDGDNMSNTGLVSGTTADPVSLPTHDRQAFINQINASGITRSNSDASCSGSGQKTWLANTHITSTGGDVQLNNSCKIVLQGDVWIDSSLELNNSSEIVVDGSLTSPPTIMVDGSNGVVLQNSSNIVPNSSGVSVKFVTYYSDASCSPDCADVTGQDLYDSRDNVTVMLQNSASAPGAFFYAKWSKVLVQNNGSIGSITGQTIELQNSANIYFGTELSSGDSVWSIRSYQEIFD
ncbi:MAG: hypothetical protein WDZ81_00875 [Candidatus Saccharimonadales bacterium]